MSPKSKSSKKKRNYHCDSDTSSSDTEYDKKKCPDDCNDCDDCKSNENREHYVKIKGDKSTLNGVNP